MNAPEFDDRPVGRHCDHLPYRYSGPEGVVLHDREADKLIEQSVFRVMTDAGERVLSLRIARGTIRDMETNSVREEATGHVR